MNLVSKSSDRDAGSGHNPTYGMTPAVELPVDAPHGSRPEQIYVRLRDLIVQGQLAPGNRIIETEIAGRLGVSRTPVREALQRLQREGFVIGTPGAQQSRLTVAPLTKADVHELLDIVGALEGLGAHSAAQLAPEERRALGGELAGLNDRFREAAGATPIEHSAVYDADELFHHRIVAAAGGPRLLALHDAVKPQAERYIRMYISLLTTNIDPSVDEHEAITTAIVEGRAADAERAAVTNWRHAAERLSKVIDVAGERGSW